MMENSRYLDAVILLRLLIAMILAGIIGWDREHSGHSAGLRTNMLVGMGAALFTNTGDLLIRHFQVYDSAVHADPIRVLQAIVLGISFLGSGVIFVSRHEDQVHGLTTAASVWTVTGVGIVVGLGHYALGAAITALVLIVLEAVRKIEGFSDGRKKADPQGKR
jgi:putative Mg2+ transporter-C (MgtC) family protein